MAYGDIIVSSTRMTIDSIEIDQTLHGYSDGHHLIAGSARLSGKGARTMLDLSDLSGPSMIPGFEDYLTGYPIPGDGVYALAYTWYAPEMSRPGCV